MEERPGYGKSIWEAGAKLAPAVFIGLSMWLMAFGVGYFIWTHFI